MCIVSFEFSITRVTHRAKLSVLRNAYILRLDMLMKLEIFKYMILIYTIYVCM